MSAPVMLVIGGSRGIGAAITVLSAERGYDVAFTYTKNKEAAEKVADEVRATGRRCLVIHADAAKEEDAIRTVETTVKELGGLDAMIYNAGITGKAGRLDVTEAATIREVLDVNTFGPIIHAREAIKTMSTKHGGTGGSIVFIASRASAYGGANNFVWYAASKGGVDSLTIGLSRELGGDGIRVNAVAPGPIQTDLTDPAFTAAVIPTIALGRLGVPREIATAALFLCSDDASFITGTIVLAGGGR